ncbi:hypothetical protein DFA_05741 [Cavenderia fasciculata]|uniref:RCC1-like domain-containing protein n=1 Tax=Cavenderia fasciculata TaxID=261658 RepID=F4PMG0_CACFS|nr:uncharacterized protein DFA_05741 [Cavenderia fasciculata]EGG23607.1 hypothetical protein DFA_05741 [Cavenderia fasciculata]|eukprot:XP_004361458.1 hypothetical protein DFA_05741 [Cavenderia fasciculata]
MSNLTTTQFDFPKLSKMSVSGGGVYSSSSHMTTTMMMTNHFRYYSTKVYSWGSGTKGKLGHGIDTTQIIQPKRIEKLDNCNVDRVSCGTTYSLFARSEPIEFYGVGDNGSAQLIVGNGKQPVLEEIERLKCDAFSRDDTVKGRKIRHLSSGTYHNACIFDDGTTFLWGIGNSGQIGSPVYRRLQFEPYNNTMLKEIGTIKIECGSTFTLALTDSGDVYSFGSSVFNELGHDNEFNERVPTRIDNPLLSQSPIIDISCGFSHSMALSRDNRLFVWGRNQESQCHPIEEGMVSKGSYSRIMELDKNLFYTPDDLASNATIIQIQCASFSNYILTSSGTMYSFGSNDQGQLGVGKEYKNGIFNHIKEVKGIKRFWAKHKYVIAYDGDEFYGWGSNFDYQLTHEKRCSFDHPVLLPNIKSILNNSNSGEIIDLSTSMSMVMAITK